MGIEWYRDLSIIVFTLAATIATIVAAIIFIRLHHTAQTALDEVKMASILTRETAAIVRQGVKPVSVLLALIRWASQRYEHTDTGSRRHGR